MVDFTTVKSVEIRHGGNLGPSRGRRRTRGRALSASRLALLEMLESETRPVPLAALARHSGLHENTVRGHLEALAADGLVSRRQAVPSGRGRPAWLWSAAEAPDGGGQGEVAGELAAALAETINRTSSNPGADAIEAGRGWGHERVAASAPVGRPPVTGPALAAARRRVVELLDEAGFAPRVDRNGSHVRLTRCPLLATARRYPEIVCNVHLGLVLGAIEAYGADGTGTELVPFAEPGACVLRLAAAPFPGRSR